MFGIIQYGSKCKLGDRRDLGFSGQNITKNQPRISFTTVWQYLLGAAKPKCLQIYPKPFFSEVVVKFEFSTNQLAN